MKSKNLGFRFLVFLVSKLFFRVRIEGAENMPMDGPVLLCSNHISVTDPVFIVAVAPRIARFMAKKEVFSVPIIRSVLKHFGAFPIERGRADISSLKHSIALLKEGEMVGIFPQGTRCKGKHPQKTTPKTGAGMIAVRSSATLLPVGVEAKNHKVHLFSKITIRIGKPILPEEYNPGQPCPSEYQRITDLIFQRICELVPRSEGDKT